MISGEIDLTNETIPMAEFFGAKIYSYLLFVVALVTHKYQKLARAWGPILLDYFTFVMNQEKHAGP